MDIKDVKRVTIAGCGTEGSQIASMVAYKGFETTVWLRARAASPRERQEADRRRAQRLEDRPVRLLPRPVR